MQATSPTAVVAPSLTYSTAEEYTAYLKKLEPIASRIHIDVSDGILTPVRSIGLPQVWWPQTMIADVHIMYQRPLEHTEQLVSMKPNLVVVHPEAEGDLKAFGEHLHQFGIMFGIVIMPGVGLTSLTSLLEIADHAMIFSGKLGYYGGHADPERFEQVKQLKRLYPKIEIGWDGGANASNVHQIAHAGVNVLNVGSGLSKMPDLEAAYATLISELTD